MSGDDSGGGTDEPRRDYGAYVFLALMVLIGSSTATAAKFAVRELPPSLLPMFRFGVAGLCLLPIALRGGALKDLLRENPVRLLIAAALCVPINQAFFLYGTRLAPTTHVGLMYGMCPLVVLGLATLLGQERLNPNRALGIATTVAGAVVIALGSLLRSDSGPRGPVGRPAPARCRRLVGGVPDGQQAPGRPARVAAGAGRNVPGGLSARPADRPGHGAEGRDGPVRGLDVRLARDRPPGAGRHGLRPGLPEPGPAAVRRQPGGHRRQRGPAADDPLGRLAARRAGHASPVPRRRPGARRHFLDNSPTSARAARLRAARRQTELECGPGEPRVEAA